MKEIHQHPIKKWEVSIIKLEEGTIIHYKVSRRLPEMVVAETKIFSSKDEAVQQFEGMWKAGEDAR